jgi:protein-S-isoprenylcysteine O-methyltransferase Ste14
MSYTTRRLRHIYLTEVAGMLGAIAEAMTYACWGVTGLVWAAGVLLAKRGSAVTERAGRDVASPMAVIAGVGILVSPAAWWQSLTMRAGWVLIAGLVLLLAATGWAIGARVALGSMWASGVVARRDHQLRTGGPYRITRHPVYTGILGMLAGTTLALGLGRWVALTAVVALILVAKARAEERLLAASFPAEYEEYARKVPMIVPGAGSRRRMAGGTIDDRGR